jgi:FMN-binding domain
MTYWKPLVIAPALVITSGQCFAVTYLTVEQAQKVIFPGATFSPLNLSLTPAQKSAIEKASGVRLRKPPRVWRVRSGGWFIADEVLGKHEFITFALGLTSHGAVKQIEIMDYRESYGYQIRDPKWRAQFAGKTAQAPLRLDHDIRNISGATLSSRHVTEGVRRLLALYEIALR